MKKIFAVAVLVGLATAAFAQSQVDVSVAFQAPDLNAAEINKLTTYGDQKSKKAINLTNNAKFTQTFKLDDANTVKTGAAVELYLPFFVGNVDPYKSQLAAKVIEPFVQYQGFGLDAQTSVAVTTYSPADTSSGENQIGTYTPLFSTKKPLKDNAIGASNYVKVSYKYAFDKTLSVTGAVEADTSLVPITYLVDVKPAISTTWTFLQADAKLNVTFKSGNYDDVSASTTKNQTQIYLEPKLTGDLSSLDASLKGLKLYTGGKFILSDVTVLNGNSTNNDLKGSRWDNGAAYSFTVKDVGTFGLDSYVRVGGIGPKNTDKETQIDFNLKATYTIKF